MLTKEQAIEISREPDARLVDSLRARRLPSNTDRPDALSQQAADEIERLRTENTALKHELEVVHNERIDNLVK